MRTVCRSTLCIAFLIFNAAYSQDPRGAIIGRVLDASSAVLVGSRVAATNVETGVSTTAVVNEQGRFRILLLPAGIYRLRAEMAGFKTFSRDDVQVQVGETVEIDVRMEVGNVTETIKVVAATPVLDTATSSLGQVIDQRRLSELPQRGGNPLELARLNPGVVNAADLRVMKASSPNGVSQISVAGSGTFSTEFQIDGITNTAADTAGQARVAFVPPSNAVSEFKIETAAYDASVGHTPGPVVNISTKGGTNELHGDLHYWAANSAFNAPNFFENQSGAPPAVYQDHRYGASAGGPVVVPHVYDGRNRTFWFYSYEGDRWGRPKTQTNTVPTPEERLGDFSALLAIPQGSKYQIYNPFSTRSVAGGHFQRDPFPGNIIPKSLLDPVGMNLVNLYPLPNQAGKADGRSNQFYNDVRKQHYNTHLGRIDHAFSGNHRIFARFNRYMWQNKQDRMGPDASAFFTRQARRGVALDDVIVLSPRLVLNLRYGLTDAEFGENRATQGYDLASLGFSPALTGLLDKKLATVPRVTIGSFTALSNWSKGDGANTSISHTWEANATYMLGAHSLRFGSDVRLYRAFGNRIPRGVSPDLSYSTSYTRGPLDSAASAAIGQELAAMLLGIPGGSMERTASYAMQDDYLGLYLQDDFKISSNLTLNLGLRLEHEAAPTERFDRLVAGFAYDAANPIEAQAKANYAANPIPELSPAAFAVRGGLTWVGQNGASRSPFQGEAVNYLPRIGLAWQMEPSTVLRAGYGIFYDTIGVNRTMAYQTGFSQGTPIQASLDNGLTYVANNANPFPSGLLAPLGPAGGLTTNLGQNLTFYNPDRKHPYSQRWSVGLQRMLPKGFMLETSYVGTRGTHLGVDQSINNMPAQYLSHSPTRDQATIDYLTAKFPNPFYGLNSVFPKTISRASLLTPYPEFGSLTVEEPIGYSWYHSLQVRGEKRFSQGYTLQFSYAYSKFMQATEFLNPSDAGTYRTISDLDRPHRLTVSGLWEIPVGKGRRYGTALPAAADLIVGGWQLTGSVIRQAGPPLDFGNVIFNGDIKSIDLPKDQRSVDHWFNAAGFQRDPSQQLQNNLRTFPLRLSGARGDGQSSWDFSLIKNFPIRERVKLQFRAEAYNALNHPSFATPNMSPVSTTFGTITSTDSDGRNWQFALILRF